MSNLSDIATHTRASSATYVDSDGILQTAAINAPRVGHHLWNGTAWVDAGYFHESEARTNLLLNSGTLFTQSVTVTAAPHTLHFTGTGTVTISGASTAGPLVGTGAGEQNRVSLTFTPTAASLTLTVSGTVADAQLEAGSTPSSYIPTAGSTVTRAADVMTIPAANLPWPTEAPLAVSIQMSGTMTYADDDTAFQVRLFNWQADSQNLIYARVDSRAADSFLFVQGALDVFDFVETADGVISSGINVPFNIASRHGSTFINGAVDGTALTADLTPTALPDLSATDMRVGFDFMGTIDLLRMWKVDLTDEGIAEAST